MRVTGKAEADSWSVIVSDSGPGIPAEALDRVFEPFFRLARDEHSGIEGSGLGLAICRELVTQLQGEIALNSVVGEGTSISVRFPASRRLDRSPDPAEPIDGDDRDLPALAEYADRARMRSAQRSCDARVAAIRRRREAIASGPS